MITKSRLKDGLHIGFVHLVGSSIVAALPAALVLLIWYPYPYRELAGGKELFFLIVAVDVICGPLLTTVLYNRLKSRTELVCDLGFVALVQLAALGYGLFTVWQARPLFLVQEIDRFKVVTATNLDTSTLITIPKALKPGPVSGPVVVALREAVSSKEREKVLMESIQGGRDYAERPEFYVPYEGSNALKSLKRAKPLAVFLEKQPQQADAARKLAVEKGADMAQWLYLPVVARQDWVAVLDKQGQIQGFLKGDGF